MRDKAGKGKHSKKKTRVTSIKTHNQLKTIQIANTSKFN